MSDKVRIGIIGAGAVSDYHHVPGINIDPRCELVAICDPNEALLEQRQKDWGPTKTTTDHEEIAANSDIDAPDSGGKVIKVDATNGEVKVWYEDNCFCAEPMFVPDPDGTAEDDGVLLFAMIHGSPDVSYTALVVLDARTMTELGRAEFKLIGPAMKPLHGYFTGNNFSSKKK